MYVTCLLGTIETHHYLLSSLLRLQTGKRSEMPVRHCECCPFTWCQADVINLTRFDLQKLVPRVHYIILDALKKKWMVFFFFFFNVYADVATRQKAHVWNILQSFPSCINIASFQHKYCIRTRSPLSFTTLMNEKMCKNKLTSPSDHSNTLIL